MANNCLVTKLKSSVSDDTFLKIGEFSFEIKNTYNNSSNFIQLYYNPNETINSEARIIGDGYFTDSTKTQNLGQTRPINTGTNNLYFSKGNYIVIIPDKYKIYQVGVPSSTGDNRNIFINIKDFKYSQIQELFDFRYSNAYGNINAITGTHTTQVNFGATKVTGDVGKFLAENWVSLLISFDETNGLYGDISLCNDGLKKFSDDYDLNHGNAFTWEHERDNNYKIIAFCGANNGPVYFGDYVDAMLINQAKCQVGFAAGDAASYKTIKVNGLRSSASDAAVSTLKTKGYTVIVNGETL